MHPPTSTQEDPYVIRTDHQGIATLMLNRAQQFNALSQAMIAALQAELDAIAPDPAVRVVIIAGAGKAFCAGHDPFVPDTISRRCGPITTMRSCRICSGVAAR